MRRSARRVRVEKSSEGPKPGGRHEVQRTTVSRWPGKEHCSEDRSDDDGPDLTARRRRPGKKHGFPAISKFENNRSERPHPLPCQITSLRYGAITSATTQEMNVLYLSTT
ncbi:Uncharacterized protein Rs2_03296 [Raphanus sativus]|nr:Uncharacterized protein Rs2_03296 [Raphanus sativus]